MDANELMELLNGAWFERDEDLAEQVGPVNRHDLVFMLDTDEQGNLTPLLEVVSGGDQVAVFRLHRIN